MELKKLHCCCGEVYLDGYWNIDVEVPHYSCLVSEATPEEIEVNRTSVAHYHKYELGKNPLKKVIVDEYVNLNEWPYVGEQFEEIIIINSFEHFSRNDASQLLDNFQKTLVVGGSVYLDVPDIETTIRAMRAGTLSVDFAMRHIYGSYKTSFNVHRYGYTIESLGELLRQKGFRPELYTLVPHCYPVLAMRGIKTIGRDL